MLTGRRAVICREVGAFERSPRCRWVKVDGDVAEACVGVRGNATLAKRYE